MRAVFVNLLLTMLLASFFLSGCNSDQATSSPAPAPVPTIIKTSVNVIADSLMADAQFSGVDSAVIVFDTAVGSALALEPDDIIVSAYRHGLLRKVIGIDTVADQIQVTTTPAALTDIFTSVAFSFDTTLTQFSQTIDLIIYDRDSDHSTLSDQIKLHGAVSFDSKFDIGLTIVSSELSKLSFEHTVTSDLELIIDAGLIAGRLSRQESLQTYMFDPIVIWVDRVPIVITPELDIKIGCDVVTQARLSAGLSQQSTATGGLEFRDNSWHPIASHSIEADPIGPTLTDGADAKMYVGPEMSLLLYGVPGPQVEIDNYAKLEADLAVDPWWQYYSGASANGGVEMAVFSHTVSDYGDDQIMDARQLLARAASTASGYLNGYVRDAVTDSPIAQAEITLLDGSVEVATGQTDAGGQYRIAAPIGDDYIVTVSKTGYVSVSYYGISISSAEEQYLETILQIGDAYAGDGSVSGRILNALTGDGVTGLDLHLRTGINHQAGDVLVSTTTGSDGDYLIDNLLAGSYTAEVSGAGYITTFFTITCIGSAITGDQDATISPVLPEDEIRIVLTWGELPVDLDAHLFGPLVAGGRFHLFFPYSVSNGGSPWPEYVSLDLDDLTSYGPETISIRQQIPGIYEFSIHDYSNRASTTSRVLSNSGAQVRVYNGSTLLAFYSVPIDTGGTFWKVFEIDGSTITAINEMTYVNEPLGSATIDNYDQLKTP